MTVLIAYGTIEGQTGKIARFVADLVEKSGRETRLFDTTNHSDSPRIRDFDTVILAASVHERRHPVDFEVFATANNEALNRTRTLMISVSMSAAFVEGLEEAQDYVDEMKMRCELTPTADLLVAGAVKSKSYDYYASQVLKYVVLKDRDYDPSAEEHEFTDWDALRDGVTAFLEGGS